MQNTDTSRYLVGIDLGTTNTVVAYAELADLEHAEPTLFEIDQLVAPGEVARKPLLPSFRYHPAKGELATADLNLPWGSSDLPGELGQVVIGSWARELGSKVDGRGVASAKSWLSHPKVERTAPILPWAAADEVEKVSPVLASASYLNHIRRAWNHQHPNDPLEQQEVVVTVPASFDEAARALTVEAAALAGLPKILLLEEPQAVCYDWYARHKAEAPGVLTDSKLLLVCDIGGGTTDLSLIRIRLKNSELTLDRIGVGDHLMLGGDNVDLALARIAEQRIVSGQRKLSTAALSQLIQQTRHAKERLLATEAPERATVTVLGSGARLIGGAKHCELQRDEVRQIALEGFFPLSALDELPQQRRGAIVEFGLPYVADPAISRHIAAFLNQHSAVCREALGQDPAVPDTVLFNGGLFNSPTLAERALALLEQWRGQPVKLLANPRPDLAVAYGAVAYGLARRGALLRIGGGAPRSYFLAIDEALKQGVCLLPRGSEEGIPHTLPERRFALRLGQPVSFHLVATSGDQLYQAGQLSEIEGEQFKPLPPLVAALESAPQHVSQHVTQQGKEVEVELVTTLTEVGTLQIECVQVGNPEQRWQVEFELRKQLASLREIRGLNHLAELPPRFEQARAAIEQVFGPRDKQVDPKAVKQLRAQLEKLLGPRDEWPTPLLRALCDLLLDHKKRRRRSPQHERVWFTLMGFTLRPGFGAPLDEWRIEQLWPLYQAGLQHGVKENPGWIAWWTCWRRVAGGMNQTQQQQLFKDVARYINPVTARSGKTATELKYKAYEEMVRLAASLERLPVENKIELAQWLFKRLTKASETPSSWWAVGRLASRVPFHGSSHNVIPADQVETWLPRLLTEDWRNTPHIAFAAVMMGRRSGDRSIDLNEEILHKIADKLRTSKATEKWIAMIEQVVELDEAESGRVFGERLPPGLKLID